MKKVLTSILFLCLLGFIGSFDVKKPDNEPSINASFTTEYCRGWEDGYAAGWCYGYFNCFAPHAPICPTPMFNKGESWEDYRAGYNRGFLYGKAAREKRGF